MSIDADEDINNCLRANVTNTETGRGRILEPGIRQLAVQCRLVYVAWYKVDLFLVLHLRRDRVLRDYLGSFAVMIGWRLLLAAASDVGARC